jgi:hypothetical protein
MDHHYIPKFWLKRWADDKGRVLRHRKRPHDGQITSKRLSPKSFAFVEDLYKSPYPDEEAAHKLERKFFGAIDDTAAVALDELLAAKAKIPGGPLRDWVHFVMSLMFRTPAAFRELHHSAIRHYEMQIAAGRHEIEANDKFDQARAAKIIAAYEDAEHLTKRLHAAMPKIVFNEAILDMLESMEWMILTRYDDCPSILLSDEPVMRPIGLREERGHLAMPLTPDKLLIGVGDRRFGQYLRSINRKEIVKELNKWTVQSAREFVVSVDNDQDCFIHKHFGVAPKRPLASAANSRP